jgi:type I restriction enzyme R subunit
VGRDQQAVNAKFAEFLDGTTATANQIDFIGVVVSYLTTHGAMEPAQLYERRGDRVRL